MIRDTLEATARATFSVLLPNPAQNGMPSPVGTGFFVSPDGWFVTAAHVVSKDNGTKGEPRDDIGDAWLQKEPTSEGRGSPMCQWPAIHYLNPELDIAILRIDYERNKKKAWLEGSSSFPYLQVSARELELAEPVYAFGYPLSRAQVVSDGAATIGSVALCPRVTSAITASKLVATGMIMTFGPPKFYVIDKALNPGNSGGPIVSTKTGHVHAVCSSYQTSYTPQPHLPKNNGQTLQILVPSLYGYAAALQTQEILQQFQKIGIPISTD